MRLSALLLPVVLLLLPACFQSGANLTESGKGKPVVSIAFPETASAGSVERAAITIENPGPGDIDVLVVAFAAVGPMGGQRELPVPLVGPGSRTSDEAVVAVDPEPRATSNDGAVYTFDGLEEGESMTIAFDITIPDIQGVAANSVQVYDGAEVDRAQGVRLETAVGR